MENIQQMNWKCSLFVCTIALSESRIYLLAIEIWWIGYLASSASPMQQTVDKAEAFARYNIWIDAACDL